MNESFGNIKHTTLREVIENPNFKKKWTITKVNNSRFGLGASVWSKDIERALKICGQVEVGSVAINQMMSSDPRLPFGGIKKSGFGREMGAEGYYEFLNLKTIIVPNE